MDPCHLKHAEAATPLQSEKEGVVLQGENVKYSGCKAVFAKQGARIVDTQSRLPGMAGEANDAVSVCTQVQMNVVSRLLQLLATECPAVWIRLSRNRHPANWNNINGPVVEIHLYGHPLAGLLWERNLEDNIRQELKEKSEQLGLPILSSKSQAALVSKR